MQLLFISVLPDMSSFWTKRRQVLTLATKGGKDVKNTSTRVMSAFLANCLGVGGPQLDWPRRENGVREIEECRHIVRSRPYVFIFVSPVT